MIPKLLKGVKKITQEYHTIINYKKSKGVRNLYYRYYTIPTFQLCYDRPCKCGSFQHRNRSTSDCLLNPRYEDAYDLY